MGVRKNRYRSVEDPAKTPNGRDEAARFGLGPEHPQQFDDTVRQLPLSRQHLRLLVS